MKHILSLVATIGAFLCFLLGFYMSFYSYAHEQLGWNTLLFLSMALLLGVFSIDEKGKVWRWIEIIGAVGCIGIGVFSGLHYIQVL